MRAFHACLIPAVLTLLALTIPAAGQPEIPEGIVRGELICDYRAVEPGQPFQLGVLFQIMPEWHIYWRYPGDAGLPTEVRLELPEGFEIGPVRWPVPDIFMQPGDIEGYGYSSGTLLLIPVRPPVAFDAPSVPITVHVSWLSCLEVCVPGRKTLRMELPVSENRSPAHTALFDEWVERLPLPYGTPETPFEIRDVSVENSMFRIHLEWKQSPRKVQWIPAPDRDLLLEQVQSITDGRQTRLQFRVERVDPEKPFPDLMHSLIVYESTPGNISGAELPVPLKSAQAPFPPREGLTQAKEKEGDGS
ncbi:hypothetical protein HQ520_13480 [bacterium]|nr:hypothetical protein [bacterium]